MRVFHIIAVVWLMLACALAPAHAEKRVALVVGNDRYANLPQQAQLHNAVNDARAVAASLRQIGFDVIAGENLPRGALVDRFGDLMQRLEPGDTAFFFYSGHGVALDGVNYILPTDVPDAAAGQEARLKLAALGESDIIAELGGRGVRVAVVVLDACRTNPFGRTRPGGVRGVGGEKGLTAPPQVKGVFSLYAASAGQGAHDELYDGDPNPNSVFTRVLAPRLTKQGLDLAGLAFEVREEVARVAQGAGYEQWPAYYDGTIGGRVYLAGSPPDGGQPAREPPPREPTVSDGERAAQAAAQTWTHIQNTTNLAVLDEFIRQYGDTPVYGTLARARREEVARKPPEAQDAPVPPGEVATAHGGENGGDQGGGLFPRPSGDQGGALFGGLFGGLFGQPQRPQYDRPRDQYQRPPSDEYGQPERPVYPPASYPGAEQYGDQRPRNDEDRRWFPPRPVDPNGRWRPRRGAF
jgi:hypothetical protein